MINYTQDLMRFAFVFPLVFTLANLSFGVSSQSYAAMGDDHVAFFESGVTAVQKGDLKAARNEFTKGLSLDPNDVPLLYNLGLVEQQQGQLGMALALWRKALALSPEYTPARDAVTWTKEKLPKSQIAHEVEYWESFRDAVLEPYSFEKFLGFTAAFFLAGGFLFLRYLGRRRRALLDEKPLPPFPVLACVLAVGFAFSLLISVAKDISLLEVRGTVVAKQVEARALPEPSGTVLFQLFEGLEVIVRQSRDSWVQVTYPGGGTGWVEKSSIFTTQDRVASHQAKGK